VTRIADQAYLRTRLAILSSQLLGQQRLAELARLPLDELSAETGFADIPDGSESQRLGIYERVLMQTWLDELSALLRPLEGPARRLLTQWASRYELLNIKAIVRGKIGQLPIGEIERSLFRLPGYLSLNHDALLHTDTFPICCGSSRRPATGASPGRRCGVTRNAPTRSCSMRHWTSSSTVS
jgi:V/A-type H+-transporting ATPase subunit C